MPVQSLHCCALEQLIGVSKLAAVAHSVTVRVCWTLCPALMLPLTPSQNLSLAKCQSPSSAIRLAAILVLQVNTYTMEMQFLARDASKIGSSKFTSQLLLLLRVYVTIHSR